MTVWSLVRLGDVSEIIAGQSPSGRHYNTGQEGLPFYQGKKDFGDRFIKPAKTWTREYSKVAEKGDILMSVRAPVGPVNMAIERCAIGRGLASIRPTGRVETGYVFYYLRSIEGKLEYSEGAVFSSISKHQIADIQLPLPPLAEQKRIVARLDLFNNSLDNMQALSSAVRNMETYFWARCVSSIFDEDKWQKSLLGDVCKLNYGKGLSVTLRADTGSYPIYGANGVKGHTDKWLHEGPSLVIGRKGSAGALTLVDGRFWPLDVTYYVTFDQAKIDIRFLYYTMSFLSLPSLARGVKPGINRDDVYALLVPLPPLDEQKRIVAKLDQINDTLSELRRLRAARNAALEAFQKSFSSTSFSQAA